jgi:hypothetical protein
VTAYQVQVGVLEWNSRLLRLIVRVDAVSCLSIDIDEIVLWIACFRVHRWQPQTSTVETGPESPFSYYTIVMDLNQT